MTVLSAQSIRKRGIFSPFNERTLSHGMTFGLGPAGYDVRIDAETMFLPKGVHVFDGRTTALAATIEHFTMPKDCIAYVKDKSSWARQFLFVQNTVIEPGWRGHLTLELTYEGRVPLTIPAGSPIAQIIFHRLDEETEIPYVGKYQDQPPGPQPHIVEQPNQKD